MNWEAVGAIATSVSALVTAGSIVFIARQTGATRRSADSSARAAETASRALSVAEIESRRGQFLAVEATRARIDASTPRLVITPHETAAWPPHEPSEFGQAQQLPWGHEYVLPRDARKLVSIHIGLAITNEGAFTADLTFSSGLHYGVLRPERGAIDEPIKRRVLPAGASIDGAWIGVTRTVDEWVNIHRERDRTRASVDPFVLEIWQRDQGDSGADVTYRIEVDGTILRPVEGNAAAWTFIDAPTALGTPGSGDGVASLGWAVLPTERHYFLSRTRGIDLPDPALD